MLKLLELMKYWQLFVMVVKMVEEMVPAGTPGAAKLTMAMDAIVKMDASLDQYKDLLPQVFAATKSIYNAVKSLGGQS